MSDDAAGPAGRPRRERRPAAARRQQILDAARKLFAAQGFHATTTRDIAHAADLNDALIYRHFASKHDILTALADQAITTFGSLPRLPADSDMPLQQLLELIGSAFLSTAEKQLDLLTILISDHNELAGDTRFAQFIDDSARELGRYIDRREPGAGGAGYLTARTFMGSLMAFLIVQDILGLGRIRPIDGPAYTRHLARQTALALRSTPASLPAEPASGAGRHGPEGGGPG